MKKILFIVLSTIVAAGSLSAQTSENITLSISGALSKVMDNVTFKWDNSVYKGQYSNGKLSGRGIYKWNSDDFYVGGWSNGKKNGYAMYIARPGYSISNCDNCRFYVGEWSADNKSGKGTCYDEKGNLIYYGDFSNNEPVGTYPSGGYSAYKLKTITYTSDDKYVGETKDGKRHGYGIYIWKSGAVWFGNWKNGERHGSGFYLAYNGEWNANRCEGDDCTTLASSNSHSESHNHSYSSNSNNSSAGRAIACLSCQGAGSTMCYGCSGTGQTFMTQVNYYTYQAYPVYMPCTLCLGAGKQTCLSCAGTGQTYIPATPVAPVAPVYGGYGGGSGGGSGSSSARTACHSCSGSGLCKYCNFYSGSGRNEHTKNGNCGVCRGGGRCTGCQGKGYY